MNYDKIAFQIKSTINKIGVNLKNQNVLTEAGSGPFIATPVIAAVAGASHVVACTRNSRWGTAEEIKFATLKLANICNVSDRIEVTTKKPWLKADNIDVVTNLGFVRPIDNELIEALPEHAAVSLMWEPWEFRDADIDINSCIKNNIPIIGTNERHKDLKTFRSVGLLAVKLLLEKSCEIIGTNILIVGSNPFGSACSDLLDQIGARTILLDPTQEWPLSLDELVLKKIEAVVIVEHRSNQEILGKATPKICDYLFTSQIPVIHICGVLDKNYLGAKSINKHPKAYVDSGYMTVTTAYLGCKPVVDLHAAGLHVGSLVSRFRKKGYNIEKSISYAVNSGYGLALNKTNN